MRSGTLRVATPGPKGSASYFCRTMKLATRLREAAKLTTRELVQRVATTCLLGSMAACMPPQPPPPAVPQPAVEVAASFAKTWDGVIDYFSENNIAIRTMDRASGFIAAEPTNVGYPRPGETSLAHCGTNVVGEVLPPTHATYNIVVRGDSVRSTIRTSVRFVYAPAAAPGSAVECASNGLWERRLNERVAARAENRAERDLGDLPPAGAIFVTDSSGMRWTVTQVPAGYGRPSGLEFTSRRGEVRYVPGVIVGWQTLPQATLTGLLPDAKVLRKPR